MCQGLEQPLDRKHALSQVLQQWNALERNKLAVAAAATGAKIPAGAQAAQCSVRISAFQSFTLVTWMSHKMGVQVQSLT